MSRARLRARCLAAAVLVLAAGGAPAADPRPPAGSAAESRVHVVAHGDTLGAIALRYGVTVAALVAANRLAGEGVIVRIGQRLSIPRAGAAGSSVHAGPAVHVRTAVASAAPVARAAGPCCGPRGLILSLPDFIETAPVFAWPVEGFITSAFGRRRAGWHRGIDIKAERGAAIFAAAAGVVAASNVEARYGRVVKIEHDSGFVTVYAHNEENLVQPGTRVAAGDPIATVGRTGRATTYHVHFEIRRDGSVYNPLYLLPLPPRIGQVEDSGEAEEEHD